MSDGERVLIECRANLAEIRRLQDDIELMRSGCRALGDALPLRERLDQAEQALKTARARQPTLISEAMQLLDSLPRRDRKVLYMYYVLGLANADVARKMNVGLRCVLKVRASGREMLERMSSKD